MKILRLAKITRPLLLLIKQALAHYTQCPNKYQNVFHGSYSNNLLKNIKEQMKSNLHIESNYSFLPTLNCGKCQKNTELTFLYFLRITNKSTYF